MKCVKCKKTIDKEDLFCGYCGINQEKFTIYINKVSNKIHKERDKVYNNNVQLAKNRLNQLQQEKQNEINRIASSRWQSIGSFSYNMTEGKILVNGNYYLFSDIKGASPNVNEGYRVVYNTTGTNNQKSKKHVSLGGGLVGAAIAGPMGAVVGGSVMGKTTTKGKNNQVTTQTNIPTCSHVGVNVNLNGFTVEIVLLNKMVDQSTRLYTNAINNCNNIMNQLMFLSKQPVPKKFFKPEEEPSVLAYDPQIAQAAENLQATINNKPTYEIPESYYQ